MAAVGGSIESVALNNRLYPVVADADAKRSLGGFTTDVQSNGDGSARILLTRTPWGIDGLTIEVDDVRGDQEALQGICDSKQFVSIVITFCSGATYQGLGTIVDKLEFSSAKTSADIKLMGPQKLTPQ